MFSKIDTYLYVCLTDRECCGCKIKILEHTNSQFYKRRIGKLLSRQRI